MGTGSDPILQFLNPHISKSKTCCEKFKTKAFRWHLETKQSQIGSIFKLNIKKSIKSEKWFCTLPPHLKMPPAPLPPGKKQLLLPWGMGREALSVEVAGCKKIFFCQGVGVQESFSAEVAGCKTIFQIWHFFLKFSLKIL